MKKTSDHLSKEVLAGNYLYRSFSYISAAKDLIKTEIIFNYAPAIFCLRHAIELYQKTLSIVIKGNFDPGHDLLLRNHSLIKEKWFYIKFEKILEICNGVEEGMEDLTPEEKYNLYLRSTLNTIQELAKKYNKHEYTEDTFNDSNNILLRYPVNIEFEESLSITIHNVEKIKSIHEDIDKIGQLIFSLFWESVEENELNEI